METRRISERAEHELLVEIRNAAIPDDPVHVEDHLGFLRSCEEHASFLAFDGGCAIGAAVVAGEPQRETPYLHLWVAPSERRRGVGSELYGAVSAWAAERGHRELEVPVRDDDLESLAFAERRGFAPFRREQGLVLELAALEPPLVEPPAGVEIVTWAEHPALARGIYEVAAEGLPDIPGEEDSTIEPFEGWLEHDMRGRGDRPEATFVALAGSEVVGYAKFSLTDAQPATAHHDLTGGEAGLAGARDRAGAQAAQIAWAKERAFEELRTRNERRNEPIRRLNERFGYLPTPGRIYLRGPLA